MTTLKLKAGKSSKGLLTYLAKGKRQSKDSPAIDDERRQLLFSSLGETNIDDIEKSFRRTRDIFGKNDGRRVFHVSLNFNGSDPNVAKMSDADLLDYAKKFAEQHSPGHSYAVFKHSDTANVHLHLAINSVSEQGVKFQSPPSKLRDSMAFIQQLDAERGLVVTLRPGDKTFEHAKDKITEREIHVKGRTNGQTILWKEELKLSIIKCRELSEDFDDFKAKLQMLGVNVNTRGKNEVLTYSFKDKDGKQRQARDSSLGADYGIREIGLKIGRNQEEDALQRSRRDALGLSAEANPHDRGLSQGNSGVSKDNSRVVQSPGNHLERLNNSAEKLRKTIERSVATAFISDEKNGERAGNSYQQPVTAQHENKLGRGSHDVLPNFDFDKFRQIIKKDASDGHFHNPAARPERRNPHGIDDPQRFDTARAHCHALFRAIRERTSNRARAIAEGIAELTTRARTLLTERFKGKDRGKGFER